MIKFLLIALALVVIAGSALAGALVGGAFAKDKPSIRSGTVICEPHDKGFLCLDMKSSWGIVISDSFVAVQDPDGETTYLEITREES